MKAGSVSGEYLLLRPDFYYVRVQAGVWLSTSDGSFTISGASSYELLDALVDDLQGESSQVDVVESVPAHLRPVTQQVITALRDNNFLVSLPRKLSQLTSADGKLCAWLITHFANTTSDPYRAARRVLESGIKLVGGSPWLNEMSSIMTELRLEAIVETGEAKASKHKVVLVEAESVTPEQLELLEREEGAKGNYVGVMGLVQNEWWGLLPGPRGIGWTDTAQRAAASGPGGAVLPTNKLSVRAVALAMIQGALHRLGAIESSNDDPEVLAICVQPLMPKVTYHRLRPGLTDIRPAPAEQEPPAIGRQVRPNILTGNDVAEADRTEAARIVEAQRSWTDARLGPLLSVGEADTSQLPLGTSTVEYLVTSASESGFVRRSSTVRTFSTREARAQAVLNAFEQIVTVDLHTRSQAIVGVGWSRDEAIYRALLKNVLASPPRNPARSLSLNAVLSEDPSDSLVKYLLRACCSPWVPFTSIVVNEYHHTSGLSYIESEVPQLGRVRGAGTSPAEAFGSAILGALNPATFVHVSPPHSQWSSIWDSLDLSGELAVHKELHASGVTAVVMERDAG